MSSFFILSLLFSAASITPSTASQSLSEDSSVLKQSWTDKIKETYKKYAPGSPLSYDQGLNLIKEISQASPQEIAAIPLEALALLYVTNDSSYNRELFKLSQKIDSSLQELLSVEVSKKRLAKGYLIQEYGFNVGDVLRHGEESDRYLEKLINKNPFIIHKEPLLEKDLTISKNKNLSPGEKLVTTDPHGLQDETGTPIPLGDEVGYNIYLPEEASEILAIHLYGGRTSNDGALEAFRPNPDYIVNAFFLSHGMNVAELNLEDLRSNPDFQEDMRPTMLKRVYNGAITFIETIIQNPEKLSADLGAQERLKKIKKVVLYGGSFGGKVIVETAKVLPLELKKSLVGCISHDGGLYMAEGHPDTPLLILQNFNDNIVDLNKALKFFRKSSKAQQEQTIFYMPKVGNLSLSEDPNGGRDNTCYVGHFHPEGQEARRREEQVLKFIEQHSSKDLGKPSPDLQGWRLTRYKEYGVISEIRSLEKSIFSIEDSFLALARLAYEECRLKGIPDDFETIYKPLYIETLIRFALDKRIFPWNNPHDQCQAEAEQELLKLSADKDYDQNPTREFLEKYKDSFNSYLKEHLATIGLPAIRIENLKGNVKEYFQEGSLLRSLFLKAVSSKISENLKLPEIEEILQERKKQWVQGVQNFFKNKQAEAHKIYTEFSLHQSALRSFADKAEEKRQEAYQTAMELIQKDPKLMGAQDTLGQTVFHLLVLESQRREARNNQKGFDEILDVLLEQAKSSSLTINPLLVQDRQGNTPLHLAIEIGNLDLIQKLSKDVPQKIWLTRNRDGLTPLALAAYNFYRGGQEANFEFLLDQADPESLNIANSEGTTLLHSLAAYGKKNLIENALKKGGKLDVPNQNGVTPVMVAAQKGNIELVEYLLNQGAQKKNQKTSLLHEAAKVGSVKVIEAFKDMKEEKDEHGLTPFDYFHSRALQRAPGLPQDRLGEMLEILEPQMSNEEKAVMLLTIKDGGGLLKLLKQGSILSKEVQEKMLQVIMDSKRNDYLAQIIRQGLVSSDLENSIWNKLFSDEVDKILMNFAFAQNTFSKDTDIPFIQKVCQKTSVHFADLYFISFTSLQEVQQGIVERLVINSKWKELAAILKEPHAHLETKEKIILGLIEEDRTHYLEESKVLSNPSLTSPEFYEKIIDALFKKQAWRALGAYTNFLSLPDNFKEKIILGLIEEDRTHYLDEPKVLSNPSLTSAEFYEKIIDALFKKQAWRALGTDTDFLSLPDNFKEKIILGLIEKDQTFYLKESNVLLDPSLTSPELYQKIIGALFEKQKWDILAQDGPFFALTEAPQKKLLSTLIQEKKLSLPVKLLLEGNSDRAFILDTIRKNKGHFKHLQSISDDEFSQIKSWAETPKNILKKVILGISRNSGIDFEWFVENCKDFPQDFYLEIMTEAVDILGSYCLKSLVEKNKIPKELLHKVAKKFLTDKEWAPLQKMIKEPQSNLSSDFIKGIKLNIKQTMLISLREEDNNDLGEYLGCLTAVEDRSAFCREMIEGIQKTSSAVPLLKRLKDVLEYDWEMEDVKKQITDLLGEENT